MADGVTEDSTAVPPLTNKVKSEAESSVPLASAVTPSLKIIVILVLLEFIAVEENLGGALVKYNVFDVWLVSLA